MNKLISLTEIKENLEITDNRMNEFLQKNDIDVYYVEGYEFVLEEYGINIYSNFNKNNDINDAKENNADLKGTYNEKNKLNNLTGSEWLPETKSFWYQKGLGKNHPHAQIEKQHPAPFSYQDISRLISFFTKKDEIVLDPFLGVGSTIKAAELLSRKGVGIELSKKWLDMAQLRLDTEVEQGASHKHDFILGDARLALKEMNSQSVDFIVTSPPYWSILNKKADHKTINRVENNLSTNYSDSDHDLGNIESYDEFLNILTHDIFQEAGRVLKAGKYMAIVVSDFRDKSKFVSFHSDLIQKLDKLNLEKGFRFNLQGVKTLLQNHKSLLPYGYPYAYVENIHHQYILIFRKDKLKKNV